MTKTNLYNFPASLEKDLNQAQHIRRPLYCIHDESDESTVTEWDIQSNDKHDNDETKVDIQSQNKSKNNKTYTTDSEKKLLNYLIEQNLRHEQIMTELKIHEKKLKKQLKKIKQKKKKLRKKRYKRLQKILLRKYYKTVDKKIIL